MLIDWFTVVAQALNFALLAWLMKRFLYKPILDAIDAREKRIASELAAASRKKADAEQERDEFHKKNVDFDQQRAALLQKADTDANAERQKLIAAAHQTADALAAKRKAALTREAKALSPALQQRAQTEVFAIARQALTDLAGITLEASACEFFISRLRGLQGEAKDVLGAALREAKDAVVVRSAFVLPDPQRLAIQKTLSDAFGIQLAPHYDTEPTLVAGIELIAQGRKFAWTISDYLASLEQSVTELLQSEVPASLAGSADVKTPGPARATAADAVGLSTPAGPAAAPVAVAAAP